MFVRVSVSSIQSKKDGKDQEAIQSSTTPDPGLNLSAKRPSIRFNVVIGCNFSMKRVLHLSRRTFKARLPLNLFLFSSPLSHIQDVSIA